MEPLRVRTARLELVSANAELARAAARDHAELSRLLAARVTAQWPPELMRDAMDWCIDLYERDPAIGGWGVWYTVLAEPSPGAPERAIIGSVGFYGRPGAVGGAGSVEMGYSVLDEVQRRGYASEAVAAMVEWAFSHGEVNRLTAHTFERHEPSLGVLRKCGFSYAGPGTQKVNENERLGRGELVLWELRREAWAERIGQMAKGHISK